MAASGFQRTKQYLEKKYKGALYLTEAQVKTETLDSTVAHLQDETTGLYILAEVAKYISETEFRSKAPSKKEIIVEYTKKLERHWLYATHSAIR